MDIIELTRTLGAEIQKTEEYKRFMETKEANDKNEELQKQIGDFNLLKMQLDAEHEREEKDEAKILEINEKIVRPNSDTIRMIMQVHDEIVFECDASHADEMACAIKSIMENITTLSIPLVAEYNIDTVWGK